MDNMANRNFETFEENPTQEDLVCNLNDKEINNTDNSCSLRKDNRGIGVVEIVLILVVLIALIIIFKDKIIEIINSAFESISEGADSL